MTPYRIVLADDHPLVREGLRRIIDERSGMKVVGEAADGLGLLATQGRKEDPGKR